MLDPVTWKLTDGSVIRELPPPGTPLAGKLRLIDQTQLPTRLVYVELDDLHDIYEAIKRLMVRGAPAIGCAAALGLAATAGKIVTDCLDDFLRKVREAGDYLKSSRPTAVNLAWAVERCLKALETAEVNSVRECQDRLIREGLNILAEDIQLCRAIGEHGSSLLSQGMGILTHCNAGALATGDYGTALAPIYVAHERGLEMTVYADETRPLLQGARLTAWELSRAGVRVVTICDNMAGQVMREGKIDLIIVGADRITANGDVANKIGTYSLAVLARYHNIPFYVAAPYSTVDMSLADGSLIPIEQRAAIEIQQGFGRKTAPDSCDFYNPAFDVTPHQLITAIITEKGMIKPPFDLGFKQFYQN